MPINDVYNREKYDFLTTEVEPRDAKKTIEEKINQNWTLHDQKERDIKIILVFYKKK